MLHRRTVTRQMEMFRELSSGLNTQIIGGQRRTGATFFRGTGVIALARFCIQISPGTT